MRFIKAVLVDDSDVYAAGVKAWLTIWPELQLVGVANGGAQVCEMVERLRPDLVLVDVAMPDMNGFEATRRIKALNDPPKVVMLTIDSSRVAREAAREAGADDFVAKTEITTALLPSIRRLFPDATDYSCAFEPDGASLAAKMLGAAPMLADLTGRAWTERVLQRFADDVSTASGTRFFDLLVEYIASCLGFDFVVVGELHDDGVQRVLPIASYPANTMARGEFLTCAQGVRDAFPNASISRELSIDGYVGVPLVASAGEVIGVICGFGLRPVTSPALAEMMLRIVAGRTAAELERERTRRALEQSEAHFRRLVEHTQDVIAVIDGENAITYVSPAIERLLEYSSADCIGLKVATLIHPSDWPRVETLLMQADESRAGCLVEARVRHRDGTWRTMESSCAQHADADGRRVRVVTARDLTERRRLEDHLRHTPETEAVGRLAGGIAHDFNDILMVILNNAEILSRRTTPGDPKHAYVEAIRDAVTRGTGLARQLVAFNRQQEFEPRRFDLNRTIEAMTTLLRRSIGSGIRLVCNLSPEAGSIAADPTQIEQVVLSLIVNAWNAMPDGGQMTIATAVANPQVAAGAGLAPGDYLQLSVADTGCGISEEITPRIFDPLFTTKEEGRGTGLGLGLATVQGIVARHGGIVQVDSVEGQGSTFRIFLPRGESPSGQGAL